MFDGAKRAVSDFIAFLTKVLLAGLVLGIAWIVFSVWSTPGIGISYVRDSGNPTEGGVTLTAQLVENLRPDKSGISVDIRKNGQLIQQIVTDGTGTAVWRTELPAGDWNFQASFRDQKGIPNFSQSVGFTVQKPGAFSLNLLPTPQSSAEAATQTMIVWIAIFLATTIGIFAAIVLLFTQQDKVQELQIQNWNLQQARTADGWRAAGIVTDLAKSGFDAIAQASSRPVSVYNLNRAEGGQGGTGGQGGAGGVGGGGHVALPIRNDVKSFPTLNNSSAGLLGDGAGANDWARDAEGVFRMIGNED